MSDPDPRATEVRTCPRCAAPTVTCFHVTQHMLNGILPIGRTYQHRCSRCQATFETESPFRSVWNLWIGGLWLVFGGIGTVFVVAWVIDFVAGRTGLPSFIQGFGGLVMVLMLAAGVYVPGRSVMRIVNLMRHPVGR